jgi:tRNA(adenine34) deaminase
MTPSKINPDEKHEYWMLAALEQAEIAASNNEVPIGAVLVDVESDESIGNGFNQPICANDPTAHAEIVALRSASQFKQNYRLPGTILYVTIEPCTMCIGALIHARVELLVFGAREPRAGAVVSQQALLNETYYNHRIDHIEGVLAGRCSELVQQFFKLKRQAKKTG